MTPSELHDVLKQRAEDIKRAIGSTGLVAVAQDEIVQILSALRAVEGAKVALGNVVTAYAKANPLRRADFHPAECACQRCAVDHAKSALTHLEGLK